MLSRALSTLPINDALIFLCDERTHERTQKELAAKLKVDVAVRLAEQDAERELASRQAEEERARNREAVEEVGTATKCGPSKTRQHNNQTRLNQARCMTVGEYTL